MAQAKIKINGVIGSDGDLPINTLVQLDNVNVGGETTYAWTIVSQPPGTTDALSATNIQNPTFTPKKEGSYLIKLVVNASLPSEQTDAVIAAVLQVKTLERVPAPGEQVEIDTAEGWGLAINSLLRRVDSLAADPGVIIGVAGMGGLTKGDVLRASGGTVIKTGLPGEEIVPSFTKALATSGENLDELLVVLESGVDGSTSPAGGALIRCRYIGRIAALTPGAGAIGDPVYVTDAGAVSIIPGTVVRRIGSIMRVSGGNRDVFVDGAGSSHPDVVSDVALGNRAINGAFDVWQRATTGTRTASTTSLSVADRWYGWLGTAAGEATWSRITSGITGRDYAMRVQRSVGDVSSVDRFLIQEIDRAMVRNLRGKTVSLHIKTRVGANFAGTFRIVAASGTLASGLEVYKGGYTGNVVLLNTAIAATPTWASNVLTFTVPSGATELGIGLDYLPSGVGAANDYFDATDVMLLEDLTATPSAAQPFMYCGGTPDADYRECLRYYQKSYERDTALGSATEDGATTGAQPGSTVLNNAPWLRERITFPVEMWREPPTVTLYSIAGATGMWDVPGGAQVSGVVKDSKGFTVYNTSGGPVVITTGFDEGHWVANADFV